MHLTLLILRLADSFSALLLAALIIRRRLCPRYFSFTNLLIVSGLCDASLIWLPPTTLLYAQLWAVTQPIIWGLQLLAVQEVMGLIFEQYPRLGNAAKIMTSSSFAVGMALASISVFIDFSGNPRIPLWLDTAWRVSRWVSWASCFVLVAQSVWFVLFPVPMVPNVRTHRIIFTLYAGVLPGLALVLGSMGGKTMNTWVNIVYLSGEIGALFCWLKWLRPENEYSPLETRVAGRRRLPVSRFEAVRWGLMTGQHVRQMAQQ